jgi:16S rRNA (adenine1518-N6/adenine1519-N6)-dimethyltransferase
LKAKKSYGQHFLTNEDMAQRIADGLLLTDTYKKVLEVGPGKGMLTKYLLEKSFKTYAVDADADMIEFMTYNYPEMSERLVKANFLRTDFKEIIGDEEFGLIGNFPYNISSQIVFKMLDNKDQVPEMVGMFQKEMAERIIATPGGKDYGVIAVLTQAYYSGKMLFYVKPGNFNPPPKVQSAVIRLERKANQDLGCDYQLFRQVVKQAFSQRRKMLRNTMKMFLKGSPYLQDEFFNNRPERLTVEEFVDLTLRVKEWKDKSS